jgi:riboflavin kinase
MVKEFSGTVVSGKGEGGYYVDRYNTLFKEKLGFFCFSGTLNIKTRTVSFPERFISICPEEQFKDVKCYKVVLNDKVEAFVVVPQMPRHDKDIIEIVSEKNLREGLGLDDGDTVAVRFIE